MIYVFDSNSFIVIGHYFPDRFPTFWNKLDEAVQNDVIISVREVFNELNNNLSKPHLIDWVIKNKSIFYVPDNDELNFVKTILVLLISNI